MGDTHQHVVIVVVVRLRIVVWVPLVRDAVHRLRLTSVVRWVPSPLVAPSAAALTLAKMMQNPYACLTGCEFLYDISYTFPPLVFGKRVQGTAKRLTYGFVLFFQSFSSATCSCVSCTAPFRGSVHRNPALDVSVGDRESSV